MTGLSARLNDRFVGVTAGRSCCVAGFASHLEEDIVEVASKTLLVSTSFARLSIFSSMSCATSEGDRYFLCTVLGNVPMRGELQHGIAHLVTGAGGTLPLL